MASTTSLASAHSAAQRSTPAFSLQCCPFCDQEIPPSRLEEISGRIAAREQDRLNQATNVLRDQHAREKTLLESRARTELEQTRRDLSEQLEKAKQESANRENAIRENARAEAAAEYQKSLDAAEQARIAVEHSLQEKISGVDQARIAAELAAVEAKKQLERAQEDAAMLVAEKDRQWAAKEVEIRQSADKDAADRLQQKLAETASESQAAILALENRLATADQEKRDAIAHAASQLAISQQAEQAAQRRLTEIVDSLEATISTRVQEARSALEKDKADAVLAAEARAFEERQKWQAKVQELQRQLENKKPDELGEGAEIKLYEALKAAFDDDTIRRVEKGSPGADVIHEIVHNGRVCGKIIYDSKNRNAWQDAFAGKLRQDQLAEAAEHAILSTNKFPKGTRDLHVQNGVIIACPARVVVLAEILRAHIIEMHELRLSSEQRDKKADELYAFMTSDRCNKLIETIESLVEKLEQIDVDEEKSHKTIWKKRGALLRSVLKVKGEFRFAIDSIIGTAEESASTA